MKFWFDKMNIDYRSEESIVLLAAYPVSTLSFVRASTMVFVCLFGQWIEIGPSQSQHICFLL